MSNDGARSREPGVDGLLTDCANTSCPSISFQIIRLNVEEFIRKSPLS